MTFINKYIAPVSLMAAFLVIVIQQLSIKQAIDENERHITRILTSLESSNTYEQTIMTSNTPGNSSPTDQITLNEYRSLLREELRITLQELGVMEQASVNKTEKFSESESDAAIEIESELLVDNYIGSGPFSEQDYHRFLELLPQISEAKKNKLRSKIAQAINEQQFDGDQQYELLF